jgi:hypothetical protein
MRAMSRMLAAVSFISLAGCSGGSPLPTAPSAPSLGPLSGVWTGQMTRTSQTGGECGRETTPPITRAGWVITQLAGSTDVLAPLGRYRGTVHGSSVVLQGGPDTTIGVNAVVCDAPDGHQGAFRSVRYGGGTLTATVNGNTMTGTTRDTWHEYPTGTETIVATMLVEYSFTITKSF